MTTPNLLGTCSHAVIAAYWQNAPTHNQHSNTHQSDPQPEIYRSHTTHHLYALLIASAMAIVTPVSTITNATPIVKTTLPRTRLNPTFTTVQPLKCSTFTFREVPCQRIDANEVLTVRAGKKSPCVLECLGLVGIVLSMPRKKSMTNSKKVLGGVHKHALHIWNVQLQLTVTPPSTPKPVGTTHVRAASSGTCPRRAAILLLILAAKTLGCWRFKAIDGGFGA